MAWEWVAPVSAAAGASVGAITTWLAARGGRHHAEALARDERRQQRVADAYVELLTTVEHFGQWAQLVRPVLDTGQPIPPLPTLDEQARVQAVVSAYASGEVKELFTDYLATLQEILKRDRLIGDVMLHGDSAMGRSRSDLWYELDQTLRPREAKAHQKLSEQVSTELRGEHA